MGLDVWLSAVSGVGLRGCGLKQRSHPAAVYIPLYNIVIIV